MAKFKGSKGNDNITGTSADDHITGNSGNDVLAGDGANDHLIGNHGDDDLSGGAGNDRLKGNAGDDTLRGNAGDDELKAGAADDSLLYNMAANVGAQDVYDGGSGHDSLTLEFTREEWFRADVQDDIARFLQFIADHTDPETGQADGERFTFESTGLTVRKIEELKVTVDGVELDPADDPVVAVDDAPAATAGEHDTVSGNVLDNDSVADLVREVRLVSGPAAGEGTVTLDAAGNYTYDPGTDFNALAVGETATASFIYEVEDADGDTDQATVTITITGTNDAPSVTGAVTGGATEDDAGFSVDLLAGATDPDTSDVLNVSGLTSTGGDASGVTVSIDGNSLDVAPGAYNHLAVGESEIITYEYLVDDGNGGTVPQTATITITGENDAPVVSIEPGPVNLVSNGSFESGPAGVGDFTQLNAPSSAIPDWDVLTHSIDYIDALWEAADGDHSIDLSGGAAGGLSQTIATTAGATYTVTFDLAGNPEQGETVKNMHVEADSGVVGAVDSTDYTFDVTSTTASDMGWTGQTFTFTAESSETTLSFVSDEAGVSGAALDNVVMTRVGSDLFATEDAPIAISGVAISDVDAGASDIFTVTLEVGNGALTVSGSVAGGVTGGGVSGNGSGTVVLTGTLAAINTTLADAAGLTYLGDLDFFGADALTVTADDGFSGIDANTIGITVDAVNDAPDLTFTGPAAVNLVSNGSLEAGSTGLLVGGSTAITDWTVTGHSVDYGSFWEAADGTRSIDMNGDAPGGIEQTIDTVAGGTYQVTFGLAGNRHDAPDEKLMHVEVDGTSAGAFSFTTTGGGGAAMGWSSQSFTFTADDASTLLSFISDETAGQPGDVRDGPALDDIVVTRVGADFFVDEDAPVTITGLAVSDIDAGASDISVTLAAGNGDLTVSDGVAGGLTALDISDNGTGTVVLTGTLDAINATLADAAGVVYQGDADFFGADTLGVTVDDLGNTGGGSLTDAEAISIIVDPVDEPAPVAPVDYAGVLAAGTTEAGQVSSSGGPSSPSTSDSDYWLFEATAGSTITIDVDRTEASLDPAMWIFEGVVDPADLGAFIDPSDPGFVGFADDNDPSAVSGPFGDPSFSFTAPADGTYTAIVTDFASGSDGGDGVYDYTIEYLL